MAESKQHYALVAKAGTNLTLKTKYAPPPPPQPVRPGEEGKDARLVTRVEDLLKAPTRPTNKPRKG